MYSAIIFVPLAIFVLLLLGGFVAVVFALGGRKVGSISLAAIGVLVLLAFLSLVTVRTQVAVANANSAAQDVAFTVGNAPMAQSGASVGIALRPIWVFLAVASAVGLVVLWVTRRGSAANNPREQHGGWGKALFILLLVALVLVPVLSYRHAAYQPPVQTALDQQPVAELWQQMNEPRIQVLDNSPQPVNLAIPQVAMPQIPSPPIPSPVIPSELVPPVAAPAAAVDTATSNNETIAALVTKIDSLANDFAVVAERLSEMEKGDDTTGPAHRVATAAAVATMAQASAADTNQAIDALVTKIDKLTRNYAAVAQRLSEMEKANDHSAQPVAAAAAVEAAQASAELPAVDEAGSETAQDHHVATASAAPQPAASTAASVATSATPAGQPPYWVDQPPKRVGNSWREVIEAGEYATADECYRAAEIYMLLDTYDHLMQLVGAPRMASDARPALTFHRNSVSGGGQMLVANGRPYDYRLSQLRGMGIGGDFVRREIAQDEYLDTVDRSVGPMKTLYTLVQFDPSVDRELLRRWDTYQRSERFLVVGLLTAAVLGVLGFVYGLLKIDTWTKGYYTKRLFLGVPATILGVCGLYALLVEMGFDLPH